MGDLDVNNLDVNNLDEHTDPDRALLEHPDDPANSYPPPQPANASVSLIGEENTNTGQRSAEDLLTEPPSDSVSAGSNPTKILLGSAIAYVAFSFGSMMLKVISGKQSAKTAAKEFLSGLLATIQAVVEKLGGYVGEHTEGDGAGEGVSTSGA
ncbi:hypothetical protein JCM11641_004040 [Rhodosporidiobolus odoratus]